MHLLTSDTSPTCACCAHPSFLPSFGTIQQREGVAPTDIAYDRPSPKLKPFLRRHFGLSNCLDQPNRFMVFKEYFSGAALRSKQAR